MFGRLSAVTLFLKVVSKVHFDSEGQILYVFLHRHHRVVVCRVKICRRPSCELYKLILYIQHIQEVSAIKRTRDQLLSP